MTEYTIALDQGTTSSRSILYDLSGKVIASSAYEYSLSFPKPGWVEQNPNEIWQTQLQSLKDVLNKIDPVAVKAIGITNQRETIIAWHKKTGKALAPAIVWQCRRTAEFCNKLKQENKVVTAIHQKTGLTIDPYFSASKIKWLIDNNENVRKAYKKDDCIFGTVDSWLIYNLTKDNEPKFLTDASNASRTMLYNILGSKWDKELLDLFSIKESALCKVQASNANFGKTNLFSLNAPIRGVLGDQQASLLGHGAVNTNDIKCTFGTGAFLLLNTGDKPTYSKNGLLTTIAWDIEKNGKRQVTYALEGSVFIAGSLIKWLRDKLEIIKSAEEIENLAQSASKDSKLVIIPAFSGLGAPHWKPEAKGIISGITQDTGKAEIALATLEAVVHQVADLLELPEFRAVKEISIDGGMIKNKFFNQLLANYTEKEITLAASAESTALGAFKMAVNKIYLKTSDLNNQYRPAKGSKKKRKDWKRSFKSLSIS